LLANFYQKDNIEAGCDEAGRGCIAGTVCAAAVIMPPDYHHAQLNDSKKMSEKNRTILRKDIETHALDYAVAFVDNRTIDEINILKASILAMHQALDKLKIQPEHILVDGNRFFKYKEIPHTCFVKGDGRFVAIAAASVLAKTYRDELMSELHGKYEIYNWKKNKGYPTKYHRQKIAEEGITPYHRKSFQLLDRQLPIDFNMASNRNKTRRNFTR